MELISCITPTFNRKELLKRAIRSCIDQTYPNWEMIIIDDNSTDGTEHLVKGIMLKDSRIKYYKSPGKGASAARNFGLKHAKGKYVVFLDDDDINLEHRFESQVNAIRKTKSRYILSGFQTMNMNGKIISVNSYSLKGKGAGITIRWLIEKDLIFEAGLFDETMPSMQEVELSYRIAEYEIFTFHKDVVVTAGQTAGSISKGKTGLAGKIKLMEKHKDNMHPTEAAWWYYVIGMDFLSLGKRAEAEKYFKIAANMDYRKIYRVAYFFFTKIQSSSGFLGRINMKMLSWLSDFMYPVLVNHPKIKG